MVPCGLDYGSVSAVVQDALHLLQRDREQYKVKEVFMREALAESAAQFQSGARGITLDEFKEKRKARLTKRFAEIERAPDDA